MFTLGNTFGKKSRSKPDEMIHPTITATINGTQEALDNVSKAHEMKRAELTEAGAQVEELDRIIGEKNADGLDATAEVLARQAAQSLVTQLHSAVAILSQRKQAAQRALTDATRAKSEATIAAAKARITARGPRGEELLAAVAQYAAEMDADLAALRLAGGNETYTYHANEIAGQWHLFLGLTKHGPNNRQAINPFMKYPTWTDVLEQNCG
jgi:chromosome segregation ATPase